MSTNTPQIDNRPLEAAFNSGNVFLDHHYYGYEQVTFKEAVDFHQHAADAAIGFHALCKAGELMQRDRIIKLKQLEADEKLHLPEQRLPAGVGALSDLGDPNIMRYVGNGLRQVRIQRLMKRGIRLLKIDEAQLQESCFFDSFQSQ